MWCAGARCAAGGVLCCARAEHLLPPRLRPSSGEACTGDVCRFIRDTFQDPFIGLQVTLGITRLTVQVGLGNVALAKDKCTTQHNPLLAEGSTGRPTIILDDVALFIEYPYISSIILGGGPNVGIRDRKSVV